MRASIQPAMRPAILWRGVDGSFTIMVSINETDRGISYLDDALFCHEASLLSLDDWPAYGIIPIGLRPHASVHGWG